MILESWSLMVNKFDEEFFDEENKKENKENDSDNKNTNNLIQYQKKLSENKFKLIVKLLDYLPFNIHHIVPTFMFIFNKVLQQYQYKIINSFNSMSNVYFHKNKFEHFSCQIGFKSYSLLSESGARICYKTLKKLNYIIDPELKYIKLLPKGRMRLSITEKIDDLFILIFQQINQILGKNTFLKFFMRRTLFGCEFGVCLDFTLENEGIDDYHCLIDKDPLFLFTISVKSMVPILARISIILLVYASIYNKKYH